VSLTRQSPEAVTQAGCEKLAILQGISKHIFQVAVYGAGSIQCLKLEVTPTCQQNIHICVKADII